MKCSNCNKVRDLCSAIIDGTYHKDICQPCILSSTTDHSYSSGHQSYDRRRTWEDSAQDTVQPYDAGGNPRVEFYRLYPSQAQKIFSPAEIEQVKRML